MWAEAIIMARPLKFHVMPTMDLALDIRKFRKESRLSQHDFATFVGVSQRTVSRWECGVDQPNAEMLVRLRTLMGDSSNSHWASVFETVRDAAIPIAVIDGSGNVLAASRAFVATSSVAAQPTLPTVLVVEDDVVVLRATCAVLKRWQLLSVGAMDGETALAYVAEGGVCPQAAIIDFMLPGALDGVDTALALRKTHPDLPILLITGEADPTKLRKIHDSGLALIPKPVDPNQIKVALMALLPQNRGEPAK